MKFDKTMYKAFDLDAIKILDDFLPAKIFDTHAHIYDKSFAPGVAENYGADKAEIENYNNFMEAVLSGREAKLNLIPYPDTAMRDMTGAMDLSDAFLVKELEKDNNNVGEIMVLPKESAESIEKRLVHPNIKGFKCYHIFADKKPTWNCTIDEYLPESAWEVANEKKLAITLHMVKDKALSDEDNLKYITEMAEKYKDATLILAHAARSFAAWTAVEAVDTVKHLANVWYDFSGVCESPAMIQILKKVGASRCMWGSDFPVGAMRGKGISLADTFYWINEKDIEGFSASTTTHSWLVETENLMATRQACIIADLSKKEIEDLFYNSAERLFK